MRLTWVRLRRSVCVGTTPEAEGGRLERDFLRRCFLDEEGRSRFRCVQCLVAIDPLWWQAGRRRQPKRREDHAFVCLVWVQTTKKKKRKQWVRVGALRCAGSTYRYFNRPVGPSGLCRTLLLEVGLALRTQRCPSHLSLLAWIRSRQQHRRLFCEATSGSRRRS